MNRASCVRPFTSTSTLFLLAACAGGDHQASAPTPEYFLTADQTHNRFSASIPPAIRVPSGAVVQVETREVTDHQLSETSTAADLATLSFDPIHPITGPVYVEGAEPGDVLAVTIHSAEVIAFGFAAIIPNFGFLADEFPDPYLKIFPYEPGATTASLTDNITVPLRPFAGVMGVAPDTDSMLTTIPPRANGGNLDNRHLQPGTTVYFPVFVEGGLFSIGDTHAAQGDGEVSGTGLEAAMRIVYEISVIKGGRQIQEPQYETADYYAVGAHATTLEAAAKQAVRYMLDYLTTEHGLTREEAYVLCSLAGDLRIAEVVDMPHYWVAMHMPKSVFRGSSE